MIAIGLILMIVGLAAVCWLLFSLAIYALPLLAGLSAGLYAHGTGTGLFGAILVGILAGAATLVAGQVVFATVRPPLARVAVALVFAIPAAVAGYHATHGLAALTVPAEPWRQAFAVVGAIIVGATAWVRLAALSDGPVREQMRPGRPRTRKVVTLRAPHGVRRP
ncbi:hypothetical protein [Phenylobacterium sp.]|uniref:hypothetical protein n=1 Tax=Phenylobacterium sp. TaxID=1871053 RepID=UPI003BABF37C